ncbi:hypothetical protein LR48_Vigan05g085200 [Vigna angularis]|uniref:Uncharacterized protein n=1 Tax=Phaseolus angularis TaxID=3914 RepID=A0A0L9UKG0_PHAAN|nr:hypothetical protein LR48_Vigan05g085200 [Vigna angularis]
MAPSDVTSILQTSESSTQEPTTVTTCENTENTTFTCDTVVEEETEESDSGDEEKANHKGDKGTGAQTTADGIGNAIVEDNTETENTPCTCDTVVEEETEESDSGEEENEQNGTEESGFNGPRKPNHVGDTGKPPQSTN